MNNKEVLIQRLSISARSLFHLSYRIAKQTATRYVNANHINVNDPLVNHGNLDPYVIDMVDIYHLLSPDEIKNKLRQFTNV